MKGTKVLLLAILIVLVIFLAMNIQGKIDKHNEKVEYEKFIDNQVNTPRYAPQN